MNNLTPVDRIRRAIEHDKGDDLERAESFYKGRSQGKVTRGYLERLRKNRREWQAAKDYFEMLVETAREGATT